MDGAVLQWCRAWADVSAVSSQRGGLGVLGQHQAATAYQQMVTATLYGPRCAPLPSVMCQTPHGAFNKFLKYNIWCQLSGICSTPL